MFLEVRACLCHVNRHGHFTLKQLRLPRLERILMLGNDTLAPINTNWFTIVVQHSNVNYLTCDMFSSDFVHGQVTVSKTTSGRVFRYNVLD